MKYGFNYEIKEQISMPDGASLEDIQDAVKDRISSDLSTRSVVYWEVEE